jgi:hypothetical protein
LNDGFSALELTFHFQRAGLPFLPNVEIHVFSNSGLQKILYIADSAC